MERRPTYLVEVYLARSRCDDVERTAGRARQAAEELSREGTTVRYVRTTFLPDDETCFHVFEAAGHSPHIEQPAAFVAVVLPFLQRLDRDSRR